MEFEEHFRSTIRMRIAAQINKKEKIKFREGEIFLISGKNCAICELVKRKPIVRDKITSGDITILEDPLDTRRQQIIKELKIKSIPVLVSNITPFGLMELAIGDKEELPEEEGECVSCGETVGLSMALNICRQLEYDDCDTLEEQALNGYIDTDDIIKILMKRCAGTEEYERLKDIKEIMHEHGNSKA